MTIKYNEELFLWAFATIQPASIGDVLQFIGAIFPDVRPLPQVKELEPLIEDWRELGLLIRVHGKSRLFSITSNGNNKLTNQLRQYRDRVRLFLLKSARDANLRPSGVAREKLAGDSPAANGSSSTQESTWPIDSAGVSRGPRNTGRIYWPRVIKQPNFQVGSITRSPDTFFEYYSFPSLSVIHQASASPANDIDLSITDLGIALGISPRLLTSFTHKPSKHYRQFEIGKRSGGTRLISSPKAFLKVVQYFLLDYFLWRLPIHDNSHAYKIGRSILTNATPHVAKSYVANIDIQDFFGSINMQMVRDLLLRHNFGNQLAFAIAKMVTLNNSLPQGAPTSPIISNCFLFEFDNEMAKFATHRDMSYTRYADDITISSNNRKKTIAAIKYAEKLLHKIGLLLNEKKTRIATQHGQQKVTGVVVNSKPQPPREFRREIRAMFHNANLNPEQYEGRKLELQGYLCYLKSFPALENSQCLKSYKSVINKIRS